MTDEKDLESVILLRTSDPVRARMVRALLEEEGIPVATPGLEHHSMLPHVGSAIEIIVRVPGSERDRARALVEEMEREVEEEPVPAEVVPYREAAKKRPAPLAPRLKRIALVAAVVCPGGGHFYVQRYAQGFLVIGGYLATLAAVIAEVPAGIAFWPLMFLADVIGAAFHCEVARAEPLRARWRSFAPAGGLALAGAWTLLSLGPLLPTLAGEDARTTCDFAHRCSGGDERRCLLDSANERLDRRVPDPDCAACLRAHPGCEEAPQACAACWPTSSPQGLPFW